MRLLVVVTALLAGCASAPPTVPPPAEYKIPVLKADGSVEAFTVEPDGTGERMLFCIEGLSDVLCIAEENGRALRYQMPLLGPVAPERGT